MSKVILLRDSDIFGGNRAKETNTGLKKRDVKMIAELLGIDYPPKKKEDKKEEKKEKERLGFIETVALIAIGTYFAGLLQLIVLHEFIK